MHLVLIVNILPIFMKGGQELKAHLSIEVSNGNATHNSIVVSNNVFVCLKVPLGVPRWAKIGLPIVIRTVCFLLLLCYFVTIVIIIILHYFCKFRKYF